MLYLFSRVPVKIAHFSRRSRHSYPCRKLKKKGGRGGNRNFHVEHSLSLILSMGDTSEHLVGAAAHRLRGIARGKKNEEREIKERRRAPLSRKDYR